jgi:protein required for attachment to host cells
MLLPHDAVIALVDGQNLELYRNAGNEAGPELADMPAPRPDTRNHSGSSHKSHPGNHADSLVAKDAHAIAAAEWLNQEILAHRIKDLVIIAPPRTLGELRKHFHRQTELALRKEVAKDLIAGRPDATHAALREKH